MESPGKREKVFTLATELADVLKEAREAAKAAKVEPAKLTKAQEDVKRTHNKKVYKLRGERVEETVPWKAAANERQKAFPSERDKAVSRATLTTNDRDTTNAWFHEVLAPLRRTVNAWEDMKKQPADTHLMLRE